MEKNFLTALSALAANKEIVGYSTIPTDTVLVLDLSGSMQGNEASLVNAANDAIAKLFEVNKNNRVGVVLYSASDETGHSTYDESVTRILPIDRYTTGADGVYLSLKEERVLVGSGRNERWENLEFVSVDPDVVGAKTSATALQSKKAFIGGTYIQAGLWEALEMFEEMDTSITENNWQTGDDRMPILVLMSDGAASTGTSYYDDVENSKYTTWENTGGNRWREVEVAGSNVGNGSETNLRAGNAFLTQLTASYVMNRVEAHYQTRNADVRGLFYTLGFNIGSNSLATSVMNPDSSNLTDSLWSAYHSLTSGNLSVNVKNPSGDSSDVAIRKNSYVTDKSYVDEYFSASGTGLSSAFQSIVDEIILQSRYYPTHLEGGSPDFSGYVEFKDQLGEYMEVKHVNGILLDDTLFDGHMMASKLTSNTEDGLGTPENPTALGDEFIWAIKARMGITETADAHALVAAAWDAKQLYYNAATEEYSNYIGWYAKADGTYHSFWNENSTAAPPSDAIYKIKSYGFLGKTTGSIKNSDMMYMSVQVRTDIATGQQTVLWKIPAALVPMVTYLVTLDGTNVDQAKNVNIQVENADDVSPIRLVFESGLRSDLNELNITRITDAAHIAADGVTRQFWNNYFDISAESHDKHITTRSEFTPSKENERFYYTDPSAVYRVENAVYDTIDGKQVLKSGDFKPLKATDVNSGKLDTTAEYYRRRHIFTETSTTPIFFYEKMSPESIGAAEWKANFEVSDTETGAWVVPVGTPARELEMYDKQKATNPTKSAKMVFHPYITEQNNIFYVDMNLGNNGYLQVTPAQGLKLSKTVDIYETGTSDAFRFRLAVHNADGTPYAGVLNSWTTDLDVVPLGDPTEITVPASGVYYIDLSRNQTFWLTGLPTGATYTVEEVSTNKDYKVKSVHINGQSTGAIAAGTIAAHYIDEVDFVNTAMGEGDLVITKRVLDESGKAVDINNDITFAVEVTLTDKNNNPVSGTFEASNQTGSITVPASGRFTVNISDDASFVVRKIPEGTKYKVVEIQTEMPEGFAFDAAKSRMEGVIDATANDQALVVNTYTPKAITGQNVAIDVTKIIEGNRTTWLAGESYSFEVKALSVTRATDAPIARFTISDTDADKKHSLNLSGESYAAAGTYHYGITETVGSQGGITYDTADRRFAVVVADADMDGDLEITDVRNELNTIVSKSGNSYTVAADFHNKYQPTEPTGITIDVEKKMNGTYRLNGFQFALYDTEDITKASEIIKSTITDAEGKAHFILNYAPNRASMAGETYTYYLAEIDTGNPNITYDTTVYKVEVTVKDNGDGTTSATYTVAGVAQGANPTFTNTYTPSAADYVTLTAEKLVQGDRVLNANEFSFVIEAVTQGAPMPANTTVKNLANGAVQFDAIRFDTVGEYQYIVREVLDQAIGGFAYDSRYYEVAIHVTDNGNAALQATVTKTVKENAADSGRVLGANELMRFTNVYTADPTEVTLSGEKLLTGKTLQEKDFSFKLTPVTSGAPVPRDMVVQNDASGKFTFAPITYTKAGVYKYTITEQGVDDANYDYDESVYQVTVTVTDNSRGKLSAKVTLSKNGLDATAIVFRNSYTPTPLTYDLYDEFGGTKSINRPLVAGEFSFRLINAITGKQIGEDVTNDASGAFRFPKITIPEAGIYHYKMIEVVGDEKGVSYDTASYHIRLEVVQSDDGKLDYVDDLSTADIIEGRLLYKGTVTKETVGGVLTEVTRYDNITKGGKIIFENIYKADPAHVTLEATKLLTGRPLVDGEFKFDLYEKAEYGLENGVALQDDVVLTLQENGTGKVTFMPLIFDTTGVYNYVIVEDELDEKGVTADRSVHEVEITVVDNYAGDMIASVKVNGTAVNGSTASAITFTNTYAAAATEIVIQGKKDLQGRDLEEGEFSFTLYDSKGAKLEAVQNAADGSFSFTGIPVSEAGEYVYTVKEVEGDKEHVTYDANVYTVTATVTDRYDGTFEVVYTYAIGNKTADGMTFVNVYTAPTPEQKPASKPDFTSPKTGDYTNLMLLFALLFVSGGTLTTLTYTKKKRRTEEH